MRWGGRSSSPLAADSGWTASTEPDEAQAGLERREPYGASARSVAALEVPVEGAAVAVVARNAARRSTVAFALEPVRNGG